jgi:glycosyltransferase involved in cell wall biosynthesis
MLSRLGVAKDKFAETYHLGDDSQLDLPSIRFDDTQNKILYVGTLNWEANVDGLLWFLAEIWPKIQGQDPGISLDIVGGNPDPRIVAACQTLRGVQLLGFVDDLEECFSQSRVFIAPLRFGSGIKVKVLNSMCRGLPIVTTTVGVEGLDVVNFKHIVVADTAAEYAQSVLQLMSDKAAWETIEIYSRKLIASKYTWKKVLGDMNIGVEKLNRPGGVV